MCLIIHKPEDKRVPEDWIKNSFTHNDDGWGVMWPDNGVVRVEKGFKLNSLLKCVERVQDKHVAIHMRAATSGEKDIHNCHPIQADGVWVMHNGVIKIPEISKKWSDTKHFVELCVKPIIRTYPDLFGTEMLEGMLGYFVGSGNKLLMMNGEGKVMIIHQKEGVEREGMWLSNQYSTTAWTKVNNVYSMEEDYTGWERGYEGRQTSCYRSNYSSTNTVTDLHPTPEVRETHICAGCKLTVDAPKKEWEYMVSVGYLCPICKKEVVKDMEKMIDCNLQDLAIMPYKEVLELCQSDPETIAWLITNELGGGSE
jgi:hypothetical protein